MIPSSEPSTVCGILLRRPSRSTGLRGEHDRWRPAPARPPSCSSWLFLRSGGAQRRARLRLRGTERGGGGRLLRLVLLWFLDLAIAALLAFGHGTLLTLDRGHRHPQARQGAGRNR